MCPFENEKKTFSTAIGSTSDLNDFATQGALFQANGTVSARDQVPAWQEDNVFGALEANDTLSINLAC